jgi:hypothetical protein
MIGALLGRFIAPFAMPLLGVALAATPVVYVKGRIDGVQMERARSNVAALRAALATRTADLAIANNLAEQAARDRQAERDAVTAQEDKIRDYERALATRPAGACRLTDDDVRRLRSLR